MYSDEKYWYHYEGCSLYHKGAKLSEMYSTRDSLGNKVIVRYNWEHIHRVIRARHMKNYINGLWHSLIKRRNHG